MTVRLLEELTPLEQLALIPMSYSRINTFKMCPAMYYYQYIQKEETIWGAPAKAGNVIHSVLENKLERNVPIQADQLDEYIEEMRKWEGEHDPDGIIPPALTEKGERMLAEFLDRHDGEKLPIVSKEYAFEIVIGKALFRGFIDRVDATRELTTIVDYKSGSREVTYKGAKDDLQLGIYALAVRRTMPKRPIYAELYYLRSGRQKGHLFTDDDLDVMESRILEITNQIFEMRHFPASGAPNVCGFCDFAKSEVCMVGARRAR